MKYLKNKLNIYIITLLSSVMFLPCCASPRLSFIITAQYTDRPVLVGQYKKPGEKISASSSETPFECTQGAVFTGQETSMDFNPNILSTHLLMKNAPKTDVFAITEIYFESSTLDTSSVKRPYRNICDNQALIKGKIIKGQK